MPGISWIYTVRGIPMEESSLHDVVQCDAGWQLEKKVDVLLSGCVVGSRDQKGREGVCQLVMFAAGLVIFVVFVQPLILPSPHIWTVCLVQIEDFLCEVRSNSKAEQLELEECLSATIEGA